MSHFKKQDFKKKGYIALSGFFPPEIQEAFKEETDRLPDDGGIPPWYTPSLSMANNPGFIKYLESIIGKSMSSTNERVGIYRTGNDDLITSDRRYQVIYVISGNGTKVTESGNRFKETFGLDPGTIIVRDTSRTTQRESNTSHATNKVYVMEFD